MMIRTITSCLFLLAAVANGPAVASDFLSVAANAPAVNLAPRNPGRNFLRLPTLEYEFEIHTQCTDSRSPEALSLNVADTRKTLQADKIVNDGPTRISLRIPANQIAPLVVEDFCIVTVEDDGDGTIEPQARTTGRLTIPAALSAQASLLCASEEDKAMTYVSSTLDVSLVCEEPEENAEPGVESLPGQ
jgi:hypothetical protein